MHTQINTHIYAPHLEFPYFGKKKNNNLYFIMRNKKQQDNTQRRNRNIRQHPKVLKLRCLNLFSAKYFMANLPFLNWVSLHAELNSQYIAWS